MIRANVIDKELWNIYYFFSGRCWLGISMFFQKIFGFYVYAFIHFFQPFVSYTCDKMKNLILGDRWIATTLISAPLGVSYDSCYRLRDCVKTRGATRKLIFISKIWLKFSILNAENKQFLWTNSSFYTVSLLVTTMKFFCPSLYWRFFTFLVHACMVEKC